ncbi:cationic amino acid transporter domain protein [Chlamydia psittaci 84/55]|nr:cationic amino acid transporter domain protein [Chlamydia psittaci 84/55]
MEASAPLFVTGSRMLIAGLVLVGIVLWKKRVVKTTKTGVCSRFDFINRWVLSNECL